MCYRGCRRLLEHLPEPDLLLVVGEDEVGVHADLDALVVAAALALLPVLGGDVALAVVLADVAGRVRAAAALVVRAPEERPAATLAVCICTRRCRQSSFLGHGSGYNKVINVQIDVLFRSWP